MDKMLTVSEIAEHLRISKRQAYRIVEGKDFPSVRIGRRILIPETKYEQWLNEKLMIQLT